MEIHSLLAVTDLVFLNAFHCIARSINLFLVLISFTILIGLFLVLIFCYLAFYKINGAITPLTNSFSHFKIIKSSLSYGLIPWIKHFNFSFVLLHLLRLILFEVSYLSFQFFNFRLLFKYFFFFDMNCFLKVFCFNFSRIYLLMSIS